MPDTNALITTPIIQAWSFDYFPQFEILLVPTILSELDKLKIEHRNPTVRKKAQSIISQIKEYRRRGPLSEGVNVVSSRISLRSIAVEPQVKDALPWLDADSRDDRILASFVETMRAHPRSVVALVTGDINLQNKADAARLPYIAPPERTTTAKKRERQ